MARPEDLEARVSALETRVSDLTARVSRSEHDAAAARVLAGGADRDVGELGREMRDFRKATTTSFNAMREDLTDLRRQVDGGFTEMRGKFAEIDGKFEKVADGFAEIRGRLDATAAGLQQIASSINTLVERDK